MSVGVVNRKQCCCLATIQYIKRQTLHFIKHDNKQMSNVYKQSLKACIDR